MHRSIICDWAVSEHWYSDLRVLISSSAELWRCTFAEVITLSMSCYDISHNISHNIINREWKLDFFLGQAELLLRFTQARTWFRIRVQSRCQKRPSSAMKIAILGGKKNVNASIESGNGKIAALKLKLRVQGFTGETVFVLRPSRAPEGARDRKREKRKNLSKDSAMQPSKAARIHTPLSRYSVVARLSKDRSRAVKRRYFQRSTFVTPMNIYRALTTNRWLTNRDLDHDR